MYEVEWNKTGQRYDGKDGVVSVPLVAKTVFGASELKQVDRTAQRPCGGCQRACKHRPTNDANDDFYRIEWVQRTDQNGENKGVNDRQEQRLKNSPCISR